MTSSAKADCFRPEQVTSSLELFLTSLIDYAGLFPPAELAMDVAVRNYRTYLRGENARALGRFIVPVARLDEFELAAEDLLPRGEDARSWRLSVLGGPQLSGDMAKVLDFNRRHAERLATESAVIDTVEVRAASVEEIYQAAEVIPAPFVAYFEVPIADDPKDLVAAVATAGARAKVRTGGVNQEAFPTTADLVRFIQTCAESDVPFKATAGLHHPLRSVHPFTYDGDSPSGVMHGFLNVFLAAAFIRAGMDAAEAQLLLEERSHETFRFEPDRVVWRTHQLSNDELWQARQKFATSFGSCSFREPIDELKQVGLL